MVYLLHGSVNIYIQLACMIYMPILLYLCLSPSGVCVCVFVCVCK